MAAPVASRADPSRRRVRLQPGTQDSRRHTGAGGCRRRPRRRSARIQPVEDPVVTLISTSERTSRPARPSSNRGTSRRRSRNSIAPSNVLLESPYGGRTEPRIREHFDRLVDRISTYEVRALATGDGFTEKKYEAASIDELLALSATLGTPPAAPELKDAVRSDLETANHDIPIPLNPRVLAYIELFQGRLHDFIEEGMKRGSRYLPMIQSVFRAEGLPLDLAFVPLVESAFKPNALSRAKAKGVWQFMSRHGARKRPAPRLVHRRALGPRKGHGRGGEIPAHAQQDVRRRLAPGAGLLQRRPRPDAARDEEGRPRRLLGACPRSPGCCRARRASTCR